MNTVGASNTPGAAVGVELVSFAFQFSQNPKCAREDAGEILRSAPQEWLPRSYFSARGMLTPGERISTPEYTLLKVHVDIATYWTEAMSKEIRAGIILFRLLAAEWPPKAE